MEIEKLVGLDEGAEIVNVKKSYFYSLTRQARRGGNDFPVIFIGKYCKFRPSQLIAWFEAQSKSQRGDAA